MARPTRKMNRPKRPAARMIASADSCQPNTNRRRDSEHRSPPSAGGPISNVWLAVASGVLLWMAFPPVGWWPLVWVAPIGWCLLVSRQGAKGRRRRFYGMLYVVGVAHCLAIFHWIRLPHWSAYFGWLALCGYLGVYLPLFVGLSRSLVHRWGWPMWLACPVSWCGLELARSYVLSGFSMGLLGHALVDCTRMIQIANLGGAYCVSFLIMVVAAAMAQSISGAAWGTNRSAESGGFLGIPSWIAPCVIAAMFLMAAWTYGGFQLGRSEIEQADDGIRPTVRIALVQGCHDTTFSAEDDPNDTLQEYRDLTTEALREDKVDLVVWPESMHVRPWVAYTDPIFVPAEHEEQADVFRQNIRFMADHGKYEAGWFSRQFGTAAIVGCASLELSDSLDRYNRALWLDRDGNLAGSYDKMHPVMFGEYVPLGNVFPWLYRLTPMHDGLTAGTENQVFSVNGVRLCPSICYENTVPHLIRRQVLGLSATGQSPHALITISNDGWFWGSSQLDMHLTCGVFRAIEMGRPALIAANTGFSAVIDRHGRVTQRGPRRARRVLMANLAADAPTTTIFLVAGDWWVVICLGLSLVCGVRTYWAERQLATRESRDVGA